MQETFAHTYQQRYAHLPPSAPLEFLSWRVKLSGPRPRLPDLAQVFGGASAQAPMRGRRPAYFGPATGFVNTPVYDRYALVPGTQVSGPAIIEERESTAIIPPGMAGRVDRRFNLLIRAHD